MEIYFALIIIVVTFIILCLLYVINTFKIVFITAKIRILFYFFM
ncbi:hypothetical protein [Clostridium tepidiprofundi]|nr:hypothetical protein [Clostridium tepidiprofundi]